jgi:hypothetical protein
MTAFQIIAILISLPAIFSYLNYRYFKFPATIGVMLIALLASLGFIGAGNFAPWIRDGAVSFTRQIDFNNALMQGMLCFLLFAGTQPTTLRLHVSDHHGEVQEAYPGRDVGDARDPELIGSRSEEIARNRRQGVSKNPGVSTGRRGSI